MVRASFILCAATVAVLVHALPITGQSIPSQQTPSLKIGRGAGTGGGGPMPGWIMLDLTELSTLLEANGYTPFSKEGFFMMGGGGYGGRVTGWRFGGGGVGGDVATSQGERIAKFSFSFGGFLAEYGMKPKGNYEITVGMLIGGGGAELKLLDHRSKDLSSAIAEPPNTVLERSFFAIQPQISVRLPFLNWLSLKIIAGYLLTLGSNWVQEGKELPGSSANLNGWTMQAMILF